MCSQMLVPAISVTENLKEIQKKEHKKKQKNTAKPQENCKNAKKIIGQQGLIISLIKHLYNSE